MPAAALMAAERYDVCFCYARDADAYALCHAFAAFTLSDASAIFYSRLLPPLSPIAFLSRR